MTSLSGYPGQFSVKDPTVAENMPAPEGEGQTDLAQAVAGDVVLPLVPRKVAPWIRKEPGLSEELACAQEGCAQAQEGETTSFEHEPAAGLIFVPGLRIWFACLESLLAKEHLDGGSDVLTFS